MRRILLLLLITISACSRPGSGDYKLEGMYKHKSCKYGLTCNYFEFFSNGTFRYNIILQTSQHKSFNGSWTLSEDTIHLKPYGFLFPETTKVELLDNKESSQTNISISMLGGYEKGQKPDTSKVQWYIAFDDGVKYYGTDAKGNLSMKKQYIHKIKIRDVMQQMGQNKMFRNKDSIFEINAEVDEVNIFLSLTERHPDELKYMPRKLFGEGNKLYPVDYTKDIKQLSRAGNYYKRSKGRTK